MQGRAVSDGKALEIDVRCRMALVVREDAGRHRGHIVAAIALHAAMPSGFQGQDSGQEVCRDSAAHLARDVQLAIFILWELFVEREQEIHHVGSHHLLVVDAVARVCRIRKACPRRMHTCHPERCTGALCKAAGLDAWKIKCNLC